MIIMKQALEAVCPKNLAVVFTKCDMDPEFDLDYAEGWLDEICEDLSWLENIGQDRIFLHRLNPCRYGMYPATT